MLKFSAKILKSRARILTNKEKEGFILDTSDILIGVLLGDGHMRKFNTDPNSRSNARLVISQSKKQEDLVYNLYQLLVKFAASAPRDASSLIKETGNMRHYVWFQTRALPCFNALYSQFYINRVKIVPLNIIELLTPIGLAYWIMADATWTGSGVRLHTDSFTISEVNLLIAAINTKFGLNSSINVADKSQEQYTIYIPKSDVEKLRSIVSPHMLPTFLYKMGIK